MNIYYTSPIYLDEFGHRGAHQECCSRASGFGKDRKYCKIHAKIVARQEAQIKLIMTVPPVGMSLSQYSAKLHEDAKRENNLI